MRPTVAYVDLDKLVHNYNAIKSHVGKAMLMAMVKADQYCVEIFQNNHLAKS